MRIGLGYDIHKLKKGRKLFLGAVEIPYPLGLLGHSDADVLLHAICDALLGAACLGDIGEHFPDTDMRYKDISSLKLLEKTFRMVKKKGYNIGNIDCVIFAQEPKLTPYKNQIKKRLSKILNLSSQRINIKAKTMEELGGIGAKKAMAACCVVLLQKTKKIISLH